MYRGIFRFPHFHRKKSDYINLLMNQSLIQWNLDFSFKTWNCLFLKISVAPEDETTHFFSNKVQSSVLCCSRRPRLCPHHVFDCLNIFTNRAEKEPAEISRECLTHRTAALVPGDVLFLFCFLSLKCECSEQQRNNKGGWVHCLHERLSICQSTPTPQGPLSPPSPAAAAHTKPTGTGLNQDLDITGWHFVARSGTNGSWNKWEKSSNNIEKQAVGWRPVDFIHCSISISVQVLNYLARETVFELNFPKQNWHLFSLIIVW